MLSVVADAVTTPFEAIRRSELGQEDIAVIVGVGGVGGFAVQIAAALGAAVVAIDVDQQRLELASLHGAGLVLDASTTNLKGLKAAIRTFSKERALKGIGLKIFEMSGTPAGQSTAFGLIGSWRVPFGSRIHIQDGRIASLEFDGIRRHRAR